MATARGVESLSVIVGAGKIILITESFILKKLKLMGIEHICFSDKKNVSICIISIIKFDIL